MSSNDRDTIIDVTDWEVVSDSEVPVVDQDEEPIDPTYPRIWTREVRTTQSGSGCCCSLTLAGLLGFFLLLIAAVMIGWFIISVFEWIF